MPVLSMTMPVMVEQMHQGAGENQQVGKDAEQVRLVLGPQEKGSDREKADQYPPAAVSMARNAMRVVCLHFNLRRLRCNLALPRHELLLLHACQGHGKKLCLKPE